MRIKEVLIALLAMSSIALAVPSELKVPNHLAIDFRNPEWSGVAGFLGPGTDSVNGLSFIVDNEVDPNLTWSRRSGIGDNPKGAIGPAGSTLEGPPFISKAPFDVTISGLPMNVTGVWLEDIKAPVGWSDTFNFFGETLISGVSGTTESIVDVVPGGTVDANRYGNAFVPVTDGVVSLDSGDGDYHIAGFTRSLNSRVPESGSLLPIFAAVVAGICALKRRPTFSA